MNTALRNCLVGGVICTAFFAGASSAAAIGLSTPLGWQGAGSRIIDTGSASPPLPITVVQEDITSDVNASTATSYQDTFVNGQAATAAYNFAGSISATGTSSAWRAGGYFRDEFYFETTDNAPAALELVFDIDATAALLDASGSADLSLTWSMWDGADWNLLSHTNLIALSGTTTATNYSGQITLASTDANPANLIDSGTYLPFSLGLWGDALDAKIDWGGAVYLSGVVVKDAAGKTLGNDQYTILSANDSSAFSAFQNPSPVPVPPTLVLLGAGLAGLAGTRRKILR